MTTNPTFNILIQMPNWLGDCIMAMPAIRHLSDTLPKAHIYLAARPQFQPLLTPQKGITGFIPTPPHGLKHLLHSLTKTKQTLKNANIQGNINLGLLLTNSLSTAAWLRSTGAKTRLGYNRDCRRFLLTHPIPCGGLEKSWHLVGYYLWLAKCAEAAAFESEQVSRRQVEPTAEYLAPSISASPDARSQAQKILQENGITGSYAVIAPASAYGAVKDWPPSHWRQLVEKINNELNLPVIVTGAAGQHDVCQEITNTQKAAVNLAGKTNLDTFAGLLADADAFAGGDSGGAHLAAALGIPTVVIFGVTDPTRTRPGGIAVRILGGMENGGLKLSTPEARRIAKETLAAITPDQVMQAVRDTREIAKISRETPTSVIG